ncbi:hypothetical protein DITRI_Ditri01bG0183500 [Diplodiscus trichospermus]
MINFLKNNCNNFLFCFQKFIKMTNLLLTLVFVEMTIVLILLFNNPLRNLVIKVLDKMKEGKGPVISKTIAATLFVVFISISYNVIEIQKYFWEGGVLNPTDEVLMEDQILDATLLGFALFLALVTYGLLYHFEAWKKAKGHAAKESLSSGKRADSVSVEAAVKENKLLKKELLEEKKKVATYEKQLVALTKKNEDLKTFLEEVTRQISSLLTSL